MRHVLVVDDSTVVRKIVRRILESADVRISEAANARQALAACSISMPEAILVDVDTPTLMVTNSLGNFEECRAAIVQKSLFA